MKLFYLLSSLLLVIGLVACNNEPDVLECNTGYKEEGGVCVIDLDYCDGGYIFDGDICIIEVEETHYMSALKQLDITDNSSVFSIPAGTITTYAHETEPGIHFVDVTSFMNMLNRAMLPFTIERTADVITITLEKDNDNSTTEYEIIIDAGEQTVYYNDINMLYVMNGYEWSIDPDFEMTGGYTASSPMPVTIHLADYDIPLVYENQQIYMPLYLANLLLTGQYITVYETNTKLHVMHDIGMVREMLDDVDFSDVNTATLIKHNSNFLALLLDYFYGLKDFYDVEDYVQFMDDHLISTADNVYSQRRLIESMMMSMNDLHTAYMMYGYRASLYIPPQVEENTKLYHYLVSWNECECAYRDYDSALFEYDEYYLLVINSFKWELEAQLDDLLKDIDESKDLYIDLTCNAGGYLGAVLDLLSVISNDFEIDYYYPNIERSFVENYHVIDQDALDMDVFVFTSGATFSAANLFASIVQDQDLGHIIGAQSSGGAATVSYAVLPDMSVVSYSSHRLLTNMGGTIIEEGITPDTLIEGDEHIDIYLVIWEEIKDEEAN
jgi:hypothetical protein